ncbi:MAG: hypothetical protein HXY22_03020 [Alphaproteobacteria bacterium]|nr:hypothetical protein [Alphaproteobacteria bacterium]
MRYSGAALAVLFLTGCGTEELFFSKQVDLTPGTGQMSDIKQRGVFVESRPDREGVPTPVVCAEPSPDAMAAVAASLAARADVTEEGSAGFAASLNESAASVGLRTQTIQLLRDGFYRICEGYMSGALTAEEYSMMQRRYQANMLALLAIEQLTGTVRAPATALHSTAMGEVNELQLDYAMLSEQLDRHRDDLRKARAQTPPNQSQVTALEQQVQAEEAQLTVLRNRIQAASASSAGIELMTQQQQQHATKEVADAVVRIAEGVIKNDYSGQMCFDYFRSKERAAPTQAASRDLESYCRSVFQNNIEVMRTSVAYTNDCLALAKSLMQKGHADLAQEQFKLCAGASPTGSAVPMLEGMPVTR